MSKPGDWYNYTFAIQIDRWVSSMPADSPVQFQSDWRFFNINIAALILKRLEVKCLQTATAPQGETEKWLQDPFLRGRSGHPPPSRLCPAVVETHNIQHCNPKIRSALRRPLRCRSVWVETYPWHIYLLLPIPVVNLKSVSNRRHSELI